MEEKGKTHKINHKPVPTHTIKPKIEPPQLPNTKTKTSSE